MPATHIPIATKVLASNTTTVTFDNISQDYTDLVLYSTCATVSPAANVYMRMNNDSNSLYSRTRMYAQNPNPGLTSTSARDTSSTYWAISSAASPGYNLGEYNFKLDIGNYTTSKYKSGISKAGNAAASSSYWGNELSIHLYRSTNAITRLDFIATSAFLTGSKFELFGILRA